MTTAKLLARIRVLDSTIELLLKEGAYLEVAEKLDDYMATICELEAVIEEDDFKQLVNNFNSYVLKRSNIPKRENQESQRSVTLNVTNANSSVTELPKEKLPKHDGRIESYPVFWARLEQVLQVAPSASDEDKRRLLLSAVADADSIHVMDLSFEDAADWLKKKYTAAPAVRNFIVTKLKSVRMKNNYDLTGLMQLKEHTATAYRVAKQCPDASVMTDLFDAVYNKVTERVQRELLNKNNWSRSMERVDETLEQEVNFLTSASLVKKDNNAVSKSPTGALKCYYCKLDGHLARECAELKTAKCSKCGKSGHTAKYHTKVTSAYPSCPRVCSVRAPKKPRCSVKVGETQLEALIDTGSDVTLFPEAVVQADAPVREFAMADGKSCLVTRGPVDVNITMLEKDISHPAYVHQADEAIIGADLLEEYGAIIDMARGEVKLTKPPTTTVSKCTPILVTTEEDLWKMVRLEYGDLLTGLGLTTLIEHKIDTGDHKPIAIRGRRIPAHYVDDVAKHVQELLEQDIIEESTSEWQFPLVIIKKKDGSIRMANDLRRLNEITKKDTFPMPRVDEFFEKITQARIFSRLDLRKGYYQILLREEDRQKTAFAFAGKLFHFKRMVFGACNAPATFQRLMKRVLGDLAFVFIYLDDVLIFSNSADEHQSHLKQVLDRIRSAGLTLNAEKCQFGKQEIEFLGYKVKDGKRTPNEEKSQIIARFPVPETPKKLKGFLGLANFFRQLIPDFAVLAKPLFEASNRKKLIWSDECDKCFRLLKEKLANQPMTYLPDVNKPFIVTCDASDVATGAVLWQEIDGERRPVDFMSRTFTDAEKRYATIEREATAILWALEKWDYYLLGQEFVIETDHKPLMWLMTKKNLPGKLGRMAANLQQYNIKGIQHVAGEENLLADTLSRIEVGLIHSIPATPPGRLRRLMEKDPKRFQLIDGRMFLVEKDLKRLCVDDNEEIKKILKSVHDDSGHLAFYKSSEAIRERFYWPNWKNDLKMHLKRCFECQSKKDDVEPHKEAMVPLDVEDVFDRVHLDLCGPLTVSDGNTHVAVLQDAFSKWLEAKPLKDTRTSTITDWLEREIFSRFGEPDLITTDGGTQFDSREFKAFCERWSIRHHIASPYHHQGNGLAEKAIQTLESMLRTTCQEQSEWSQHVPECVKAYNARKHLTTGVTPYSLMFNREARCKLDREFELERINLDAEMNRSIARINREAETTRVKKYYDRKKKISARLRAGQLVLWHVQEQGVGTSKKLNAKWKGPYRVEVVQWPKVRLSDRDGNTKLVHLNHVKPIVTTRPLAIFRGRGRPRIQRGRSSGS